MAEPVHVSEPIRELVQRLLAGRPVRYKAATAGRADPTAGRADRRGLPLPPDLRQPGDGTLISANQR